MCTIDWTALGTCLGAIAVTVGVVVAIFQLRSIQANEVIRATLEYMTQFTQLGTEVGTQIGTSVTISPAAACSALVYILSTPQRSAEYVKTVQGFYDGTLRINRGDEAAEKAGVQAAYITIAANYFIMAETLISRLRLDEDIIFETFANQISAVGLFINVFRDQDSNVTDISRHMRLPGFLRRAAAWIEKHEDDRWA